MISTLLSVITFTGRPLWVLEVHINNIRGITILISEYNIIIYSENHDSTLILVLYLHIIPFQLSSISLLRVYLNSIGNVTIHLNVPKNYEFHTNVGRLRLFLQNTTCTYDLVNGTAQNNMNRI